MTDDTWLPGPGHPTTIIYKRSGQEVVCLSLSWSGCVYYWPGVVVSNTGLKLV